MATISYFSIVSSESFSLLRVVVPSHNSQTVTGISQRSSWSNSRVRTIFLQCRSSVWFSSGSMFILSNLNTNVGVDSFFSTAIYCKRQQKNVAQPAARGQDKLILLVLIHMIEKDGAPTCVGRYLFAWSLPKMERLYDEFHKFLNIIGFLRRTPLLILVHSMTKLLQPFMDLFVFQKIDPVKLTGQGFFVHEPMLKGRWNWTSVRDLSHHVVAVQLVKLCP